MTAPQLPDPTDPLTPEERLVDELLSEEPGEPRPPLSPRVRRRFALQQAMHGLLRSLHSADAAAREARIARVMAAVHRQGPELLAVLRRGRWRLAAAAAILLVGLALLTTWAPWSSYFESEALAVVARAASHLESVVNHEFRGRVTFENAAGDAMFQGLNFRLVTGGKGRFVVESQGAVPLPVRGPVRLGLAQGRRWLRFGTQPRVDLTDSALPPILPLGQLDLGMLELDQVLRQLPGAFEIKRWGRLNPAPPDAPAQIEVSAVPRPGAAVRGPRFSRVQRIDLIADEATGLLRRFEILADAPSRRDAPGHGHVRLIVEHIGTTEVHGAFYDGEDKGR